MFMGGNRHDSGVGTLTVLLHASNQLDRPGSVYLPFNWRDRPWVGIGFTISSMCERTTWHETYGRLFILRHGTIWKTREQLYRFPEPVRLFQRSYVADPDGFWIDTETGSRLVLETIDYETLYLEETFLS